MTAISRSRSKEPAAREAGASHYVAIAISTDSRAHLSIDPPGAVCIHRTFGFLSRPLAPPMGLEMGALGSISADVRHKAAPPGPAAAHRTGDPREKPNERKHRPPRGCKGGCFVRG